MLAFRSNSNARIVNNLEFESNIPKSPNKQAHTLTETKEGAVLSVSLNPQSESAKFVQHDVAAERELKRIGYQSDMSFQ